MFDIFASDAIAFDRFAVALDWFGIVVFATTGALVASRKQMDIVGFVLLGTATGIGGGTIRDILLGILPVFWVVKPAYLITCVCVSAAAFLLAHIPQSRYRLLLWFDAIGMALFAVAGAERALMAGAAPVVAMAMGVVTATFGGIVRDVLGGESPVILRREIYATAALAGAALFVSMSAFGVAREIGLASGFFLAAAIRFAALRWNWSLPRYRSRPGRPPEQDET
ncbi:trimeric intracellular cation channel family protein [uncultured Ferrovibrio sp.]|jgi:Predicted membrane protein|uniref:trimeric intracellular cation channel family protein n=1 Tax=uncultured Ferrovibrio sp. TaxID=1576913 RepID=UPI0026154676|nr:trimeric intracellular cation channel family protein [uncultured Ferrovibrio sp.]